MEGRPTSLRLLAPSPVGARSDAELVAALQADLPWARRELWDRYSGRVRRYLSAALGRPSHEVEDLTQEVFLRLFVRRGAIRKPEALPELTMAIAVRVLKWNLRARWVRRRVRLSRDGDLPEIIADRGARGRGARCAATVRTDSRRARHARAHRVHLALHGGAHDGGSRGNDGGFAEHGQTTGQPCDGDCRRMRGPRRRFRRYFRDRTRGEK